MVLFLFHPFILFLTKPARIGIRLSLCLWHNVQKNWWRLPAISRPAPTHASSQAYEGYPRLRCLPQEKGQVRRRPTVLLTLQLDGPCLRVRGPASQTWPAQGIRRSHWKPGTSHRISSFRYLKMDDVYWASCSCMVAKAPPCLPDDDDNTRDKRSSGNALLTVVVETVAAQGKPNYHPVRVPSVIFIQEASTLIRSIPLSFPLGQLRQALPFISCKWGWELFRSLQPFLPDPVTTALFTSVATIAPRSRPAATLRCAGTRMPIQWKQRCPARHGALQGDLDKPIPWWQEFVHSAGMERCSTLMMQIVKLHSWLKQTGVGYHVLACIHDWRHARLPSISGLLGSPSERS